MNKRTRFLVFLPLFVGYIVGCTETKRAQIFRTNNCEFPCWNQITPGKSSVFEVKNYLTHSPYVDQTTIGWLGNWNIFSERVSWNFKDSKINIEVYFYHDIVQSIVFRDNLDLSVDTALKVFGEPDSIILSTPILLHDYGKIILVHLLYPEKGIALFLPFPSDKEIIINKRNAIKEIIITDPSQFQKNLTSVFINPKDFENGIVPWNGYMNYSKYVGGK